MTNWTLRDVSRDAAAAALFMPVQTLDVWLHRYKCPSGKSKNSRVFSLHDLTILQTARQLLSPGILAVDAMRIAREHIVDPPDEHAILYVTATRDWLGHRDDDWPEEPCTMVAPGQTLKSIIKELEAANVAL